MGTREGIQEGDRRDGWTGKGMVGTQAYSKTRENRRRSRKEKVAQLSLSSGISVFLPHGAYAQCKLCKIGQ